MRFLEIRISSKSYISRKKRLRKIKRLVLPRLRNASPDDTSIKVEKNFFYCKMGTQKAKILNWAHFIPHILKTCCDKLFKFKKNDFKLKGIYFYFISSHKIDSKLKNKNLKILPFCSKHFLGIAVSLK